MATKSVTGERIVTARARLSFPALFTPDNSDMGKGQYKATLLFDEKDSQVAESIKAMKTAVLEVGKKAFGADKKLKDFQHPFKSGDKKNEERKAEGKEPLAGLDGMIMVTAKSKYRPGVVDAKGVEIAQETDVYGGCYVRVSLVPFSYNQAGNKGVSFRLCNVQKLAEGEPFGGGRIDPSNDFGPVSKDSPSDESVPFEDDDDSLGF